MTENILLCRNISWKKQHLLLIHCFHLLRCRGSDTRTLTFWHSVYILIRKTLDYLLFTDQTQRIGSWKFVTLNAPMQVSFFFGERTILTEIFLVVSTTISKTKCIFWRGLFVRGKSLLESSGTIFLSNWQPPLISVRFTSKSHEL